MRAVHDPADFDQAAAGAGAKCLGLQLQWTDAADEGADARAVLQQVLAPDMLRQDAFVTQAGDTALQAVQKWFVDWEDEFNK